MPLKSSPRLRNLEQWVKSVDSFALGFRWTIKKAITKIIKKVIKKAIKKVIKRGRPNRKKGLEDKWESY